ncbi:hypothetical protein BaRGS_00017499 [Batillaria attramentaria]|uniref:Uncharacterized protein n=1 Tax=Batillaria attramentaria TaxID=370345 RepID=A0ABD0KVB6_9CAEN
MTRISSLGVKPTRTQNGPLYSKAGLPPTTGNSMTYCSTKTKVDLNRASQFCECACFCDWRDSIDSDIAPALPRNTHHKASTLYLNISPYAICRELPT